VKRWDLFLFAGEPSGDLHGAALIRALLQQNPSLSICGVGGEKMRAAGMHILLPMDRFQVMGFFAVFRVLPSLIRSFFSLANTLLSLQPKGVLFIDYPGFSLRMERYLKRKGYQGKIMHYICPSVWAWGKKRVFSMEQTLDLLISIFPFEKQLFSSHFPVRYVGHPLVEQMQCYPYSDSFCEETIISVFPGSRTREITMNFPMQLAVLLDCLRKYNTYIGVISIARNDLRPLLEAEVHKQVPPEMRQRIRWSMQNEGYDLMRKTHVALATSGTVTLELALHKVPTVVSYAVSRIDLFLALRVFRIVLPFYCIVNILLQKEVYPECFGPYAKKECLADALDRMLSSAEYRHNVIALCEQVINQLGTSHASEQAADLVCRMLSGHRIS